MLLELWLLPWLPGPSRDDFPVALVDRCRLDSDLVHCRRDYSLRNLRAALIGTGVCRFPNLRGLPWGERVPEPTWHGVSKGERSGIVLAGAKLCQSLRAAAGVPSLSLSYADSMADG